jgi:hypothetical protein
MHGYQSNHLVDTYQRLYTVCFEIGSRRPSQLCVILICSCYWERNRAILITYLSLLIGRVESSRVC